MMRLIFIVAIKNNFILAILVLFLCGCNHLLYPADRHSYVIENRIQPTPQDIYIPVIDQNDDSRIHAWFFPAQSQIKKNTLIVLFHGNGQNLTTHFLFFKWAVDYGFDYLIFDYRGYGKSSDSQATQKKTVVDGESVLKYLHETYKNEHIVAIGQSLGSNVLVRTLEELNEKKQNELLPEMVVLDSSFLSYQQAASSVLSQRWFLYPLKLFTPLAISDEWSAAEKKSFIPALPALFFHGTRDPIINYEQGKKNFDLWPGPKIFSTQVDGYHTSAFSDPRFIKSRELLLNCIEQVLKKLPFEQCGNKE